MYVGKKWKGVFLLKTLQTFRTDWFYDATLGLNYKGL